MEVKEITSRDTYPIRHKMLRPFGTLNDAEFQGDNDELTFHLGAFVDGQLVSVASFFFVNNPQFTSPHQYQLRGMATLSEFQRRGLSRALLETAFPQLIRNQCSLLWCRAREKAIPFYQAMGLKAYGEMFTIPGLTETGPHLLMAKQLVSVV